ncbi:hypothetical protein [Hyphomonas sp.]|uniref:hypothetical protein n=1 Tax=Hyphomonas sp. TaxID=87 RepID=UPI0025C670EF|nr:hypothetical protein [Hyphomonas sp.]
MNTLLIEEGAFLAEEQVHQLPSGVLMAVRSMGRKRIRGQVSDRYLEVRESHDEGCSWYPVTLRVSSLHTLRKSASDWPPERALASSVLDGQLVLEYENKLDLWARQSLNRRCAHARWIATWLPSRVRWQLKQLRLIGEDELATR